MSGEIAPDSVRTLADLVAAMTRLRGGRSYRALNRSAHGALPTSTVSDLLNGRSIPTRETMAAYLTACGVDATAHHAWFTARDRVAAADPAGHPGAVRARDARPRMLGVHAAIQVDAHARHDDLPGYVERDFDAALRTAVAAGGFVLLVGGSSVGKTRSLFEAVTSVRPQSWILHPDDAAAVRDLAAEPRPDAVLWLDELQRYLDAPGGVPAAAVRRVLAGRGTVVATVWPGEYARRTALPEPGRPDPYADDRDVLRLARIVDVPERFTPAELRRAEAMTGDRRIRIALDTGDTGITQVLAGGPDLIRHWENAPEEHCYGRAVITAALDAVRVAATAPLTRAFLEAAAPGYLTDRQQATAPADWLDGALAYATRPLRGAAAALCPRPAGMGRVAGYTPADYLHQHATRVRRTVHLPDTTWQALVDHHDPRDAHRLADSADRRGRPSYGERLRRTATGAPAEPHVGRPARLVFECGAHLLAGLLIDQGRHDDALAVLREYSDAGDRSAARRLVEILVDAGRISELTDEVAAGTFGAAERLAF